MADAQKDERLAEWLDQWNSGMMSEFAVDRPNTKLVEHLDKLIHGNPRAKVFVPLCGDAYDMKMLVEKGHEVVGVECSELGLKNFFFKHKIEFTKEPCPKAQGNLLKSKDGNYRLYCCDIFDFSASVEGQFDAIVDFAAMAALSKKDLQEYADMMKALMKPGCRMLLESLIYDLKKYPDSRPHCFSVEQLQKYFGDKCTVEKIDQGPHPYPEMAAEEEEADDVPTITGANYFLIKPK